MDQNLKRIAQMGIGGAKRPNMAAMAQGGIVGYFDGKAVDMENEEEETLAEKAKKRFITPGLGGIMQPNLKKLKEDAFTDIAERSGITPRESTITTDKSGFVKGTDNFNVPTTQLGKYEPPVAKNRDQGITTMLPNMPNQNMIPPAEIEKKVDNVPEEPKSGDSKEDLQSKEDAYNEWLEGLLTVLSAPASGRGLGGGNVARAYLQYSQRVFNNKAKIREIEADELEAQAKMDLNKLSRDDLTYSRLVGRQTNLLKAIQGVREEATKPFQFKLLALNQVVTDMSKSESERAEAALELRTIEAAINDIVEDRTSRERALLKEVARRLNMLGFDESAGSKKLSK